VSTHFDEVDATGTSLVSSAWRQSNDRVDCAPQITSCRGRTGRRPLDLGVARAVIDEAMRPCPDDALASEAWLAPGLQDEAGSAAGSIA
jgi:hypothetical protein